LLFVIYGGEETKVSGFVWEESGKKGLEPLEQIIKHC